MPKGSSAVLGIARGTDRRHRPPLTKKGVPIPFVARQWARPYLRPGNRSTSSGGGPLLGTESLSRSVRFCEMPFCFDVVRPCPGLHVEEGMLLSLSKRYNFSFN